jgi:hypothetical protein
MKTINDIELYFRDRAKELRVLSQNGTPWEFLCMAAFVEYLSKLVYGHDKGGKGFKDFVIDHLAKINPVYENFKYKNNEQDLNKQMYHILRCGIVHSFSFVPDKRSAEEGGRLRSIVLAHENSGLPHLGAYSSSNAPDAVIFISEEFASDIERVVDRIFVQAKTCPALTRSIETWFNTQPPITGDI